MTAGEKIKQVYQILDSNFGPQGWWPSKTPDETVMGAILTQNVAWSNVEKALTNLEAARVFTLKDILLTPEETLADLILPARFSKQKARYLKAMAAFFEKFDFSFDAVKAHFNPETLRKTLLGLKGVGPETADTLLLYAFEMPFFVIDAYTKRIAFRLGLTTSETITYAEIQRIFQENLPQESPLFNQYHALLVKLAKLHCIKKNPRCSPCPLELICEKKGF